MVEDCVVAVCYPTEEGCTLRGWDSRGEVVGREGIREARYWRAIEGWGESSWWPLGEEGKVGFEAVLDGLYQWFCGRHCCCYCFRRPRWDGLGAEVGVIG